ncbi:MAG: hypothetical protein L3J39_05790 [Verrucomicrobiales bacterium]|nr:hypothetical protein [Verrucomicrobiales bacterium]
MGLWGALLCVVLMTGCITGRLGKGGGKKSGGSVRASFLKSDHAPLNTWLDESFEVEYRKMTLDLIFEQQPIADIRYEFRHVEKESPLFSLKAADISRRDILRKIALFYHLRMSVAQINGKPAYVLVEGRARNSAFNPNDTGIRSVPVLEL